MINKENIFYKKNNIKKIIAIVLLFSCFISYMPYISVNAQEVIDINDDVLDGINGYDLALIVISSLQNGDKAYIANEYDIVQEDGSYFGKSYGYAVDGKPYGYAVYDQIKGRISEFKFQEGQENIYHDLCDKLDVAHDKIVDGLVVSDDNPYCLIALDKDGNTADNFDASETIADVEQVKEILGCAKTVSKSRSLEELYHFDDKSKLKPFYKNRYGKKYYSGFSRDILKTFTQDNVINNTGKYACTVVAAMVALSMQNRVKNNDIWGVYNALYYGAGVQDGGLTLTDLAPHLDSYYKNYYSKAGYKCTVKTKNVRFIDIKNAVDSDYKSLMSLWPETNRSGHTVPVLGYYSYFFKKDYCVDYIMIATDWFDTEEMYFDSVYLNEFPEESAFMYMKSYTY